MASLKGVMRELRDAASQLAEARGMDPDELSCQQDALLLLALAALKRLENDGASFLESSSSSSSSSSIVTAARSARRMLRPYLPRLQQEEEDGGGDDVRQKRERAPEGVNDVGSKKDKIELGQYANTHVFDENAAKRSKFARLMGSGRQEGVVRHNTFAADAGTLKRINGELEDQFNTALGRHGKKGLGA